MWLIKCLLSIITYPIRWFWTEYEKYKSENNVFMVILLWITSITGVGVIGYCVVRILEWLLVYHMDIVIIAVAIIWLYSFIRHKMGVDNNSCKTEIVSVETQELIEQANRVYPTIRNILYQTLKISAESIGGVIPRVLEEIEILEQHYNISNNICFFQFRLAKADIRIRYDRNELKEFERVLQNDISKKINAGDFPTLGMEQFIDAYGNIYDAIYIDVIEDVDNYFLIQAVVYSPYYAEYLRQKKMNQCNQIVDNSVPNAKWNN